MHAELTFSASTLLAFILVLGRVLGAFIFVPMPIQDAGPSGARIMLALACTFALYPSWPSIEAGEVGVGMLVVWLIAEMALGLAIGLMVSFIAESLTLGAQMLSLQAGYGYASVVDPTTQADSEALAVLAQLTAGLLFFTTGLHRYVIIAFAASLNTYPPGKFAVTTNLANAVIQLGSSMFSVGLRLALPILGMLLMTELALALLGRINSQLQLGMHAFPAKMLLALGTLAAVLAAVPALYQAFAAQVFSVIRRNFAF